jgi:hypothetical protein
MAIGDVVQAAVKELADLDAKQAQIDARRAKLHEFLAMAEQLGAPAPSTEVGSAVAQLAAAQSPTPVAEIRKRAAAILASVGRPMPLSELHNALLRAGVVIGGKDPRSNLSAKLNGAKEIKCIRGKGWVAQNDQGPAGGTARPYRNGAEASG